MLGQELFAVAQHGVGHEQPLLGLHRPELGDLAGIPQDAVLPVDGCLLQPASLSLPALRSARSSGHLRGPLAKHHHGRRAGSDQ